MARVTIGTYLNVVLADAAGNKSSLQLDLDYADLAALEVANLAGDIDLVITHLEAVTGAQVVSASFGEKTAENSSFYGAAGSEVENVALLTCKIEGAPHKSVSLRIPAPVDGIFLDTTGPERNEVDMSDTDLLNWLGNFGPSGNIEVSDGEQIADPAVAGNAKGKRIHRASRKG